jgi:thiol-disulfide isomerase/thioredoxin
VRLVAAGTAVKGATTNGQIRALEARNPRLFPGVSIVASFASLFASLLPLFAWLLMTPGIVQAIPPLPRKSPEFTIVEPTGPPNNPQSDKKSLLSTYRGKVILLAFVHTTCIHCQAYTRVLTKLHKDLGPGFQPIEIAWNPQARMLVPSFVKEFGIDFPVGYSDSYEVIMNFMGFSIMDRPVVPLAVVIDKKGMIRAQSPPQGDPNLQEEGKLREFIGVLLKEGVAGKKP